MGGCWTAALKSAMDWIVAADVGNFELAGERRSEGSHLKDYDYSRAAKDWYSWVVMRVTDGAVDMKTSD